MENLPFYIYAVFALTVFATVYLFGKASRSPWLVFIMLGWMTITALLAWFGFFTVTDTLPPRFLMAVSPPLLTFIALLSSRKGRIWLDSFDLKTLTILQTMRIAIEMVLFWLFLHQLMPELMTFQGRNLDILSGITAPLVYYITFVKNKWRTPLLLGWNVLTIGMLLFTVSNGILSAPSPFQQFAFEQPNVGVLLFPFIWLPAVIVPIAYYAHIISIRQVFKGESKTVVANLNIHA